METWRYHITRERIDGEDHFTIREVHFREDATISAWSTDAVAASGETWVECADNLARMNQALGAPILDLTCNPPRLVWIRDLERSSVNGR